VQLGYAAGVDAKKAVSRGRDALDLSGLKAAMGAISRQFAGREQQDAHEFLSGCLDLMATEAVRAVRKLAPAPEVTQ
ncbi:hypothetical protein T484DRAFT_1807841, partial [Baffinella frigidus]